MAEETTEFELADAARVRVLETNLLHASDVIYWLDGSSAPAVIDMARIDHSLELTFTQKPRAIKFLNSTGKTAFWSTPTQPMVAGEASEAQRQRPAVAPFVIAGAVIDRTGRFNPAAFEVILGAGIGQAIILFPAAAAVGLPVAGGARGQVAFADTGAPLAWGLLTLTVALGLGKTVVFQGQTDAKGSFAIAFTRLPPLPDSVTEYSATLTIDGLLGASTNNLVKLADLVVLKLESTSTQNDFSTAIPLTIRPGEIKRINSFNKGFIAVQTA